MFDALDFLAHLTQHIPPKRLQLIRRYGLYASRTKGRWEEMPWVAERAPEGWKAVYKRGGVADDLGYEPLSDEHEAVDDGARKRAWARLLAKVYEVDPFVCPKCGAEMKAIAIITGVSRLRPEIGFPIIRITFPTIYSPSVTAEAAVDSTPHRSRSPCGVKTAI